MLSVPSALTLPPFRVSRVSPLGSVRDTSEPWALSSPRGEQTGRGQSPQERRLKGELWGGGPPHGVLSTLPQGLRIIPSILTCSVRVTRSFSSCGKKISCQRPGTGLGHEILGEAPSPCPKRSLQNCDWGPGQDQETGRKRCGVTGPPDLLEVCPQQGPSSPSCVP